jgi:hypothetical protein
MAVATGPVISTSFSGPGNRFAGMAGEQLLHGHAGDPAGAHLFGKAIVFNAPAFSRR